MTTETCFHVKFTEIDLMGIVHHSNYPIWFEAGRTDYLKKAGIPAYRMNALGFFLPLSKIECEFKSPARYGDKILVVTDLTYVSYVKVKFEYRILNKRNGKLLTVGKTIHAWTNKKVEPLNIKKAAPEIYQRLKQLAESTGAN
ncbi:MAG: acyl-CoA thioesterase [Bacillota bacterium]